MRPGGWEPDSAGQAPDAAIAGAGPAPLRRRRSSVSFTLPAAGSARVKRNWRRARMKLMTLVRFMEPIREQQELPAEEVGSAHHSGKASPRAEGSSRVSPRDVNPVEAPDSDPLGGAEASPPELAAHDRANARGASAEPAIAEAAPRFHVPLELSPALGGMHSMYSEYDEIETNRSGSLNQHTHRSGLSSTDDDSSTDVAGEVPDSYRSQESVDTEFALPAVSLEIMEWVKAATATTAQQLSEGGKPEPGWTARLGPSSPREDVEMLEVAATMTARLSNWAQRSQRRRSSAASNATHLSDEENAGLAEWIREHIRQERAQHEASLKQRRSMGGRTPQQRHGTGVSGSQAHDRDIQTEVAAMADWIKIRLRFLVMRKKQKQQQQQQQQHWPGLQSATGYPTRSAVYNFSNPKQLRTFTWMEEGRIEENICKRLADMQLHSSSKVESRTPLRMPLRSTPGHDAAQGSFAHSTLDPGTSSMVPKSKLKRAGTPTPGIHAVLSRPVASSIPVPSHASLIAIDAIEGPKAATEFPVSNGRGQLSQWTLLDRLARLVDDLDNVPLTPVNSSRG